MNEAENSNIYCYPNTMDDNDYLKINCRLWQELGMKQQPFNSVLKKILTPRAWNEDYIVLNFFENSVLGRLPLLRYLRAVLFLLLSRCFVKKIIWVRHNYIAHNTNGVDVKWWNYLCFFLNIISHEVVAHKPSPSIRVTHVIPHPLYINDNYLDFGAASNNNSNREFLYFGQVREYKGLTNLLEKWPADVKLSMLGVCNEAVLEKEIRDVISIRGLNVVWKNEFISKELLELAILKADCVIIPHVEKSMIVTGSAFHAMSLGANLLLNESGFSDWATRLYPFASSYNNINLKEQLYNVNFLNKDDVVKFAKKHNGDKLVKKAWKAVFI